MAEYYKYQKYQKYINGVPADPPEYKQGELIGTGEYDSKADCEKDSLYRWVDNGKTVCKGYSLYNQEKKQKSIDKGVTWTDTNEVRDGNRLIDQYSTKCGWILMTRWEKTGRTVCDGGSLTEEYIKQESWDMGKTWQNSTPEEYKYKVIGVWSKGCVLAMDPIVLEIWDGEQIENAYKYSLPLTMRADDTIDNYWTQWVEEGVIYDYKIDKENSFTHTYQDNNHHIVKVWGYALKLEDLNYPYSVISWGSYYNTKGQINTSGNIFIPAKNILEPSAPGFSIQSDKADTQWNTLNIGEQLHEWVDDDNNILRDNREFIVHNTRITKLPVDTFADMNTYIVDVSDCPNLTAIPPLKDQNIPKYFGFSKLRAKNCVSLTQVPDGLFETYYLGDDAPDADKLYFALINCIGAFENCTGITSLPNILDVFFTRGMFKGCTGLTDISNCTIISNFSADMFAGCVNITTMPAEINNAFKQIKEGRWISLWDITNREEPYIIRSNKDYTKLQYNYVYRNNMFCDTKVTSVNMNLIDYSNKHIPEQYQSYVEYIRSSHMYYNEMFKECPVTTLSGKMATTGGDEPEYRAKTCIRMFSQTPLTSVSALFSELPTIPICVYMFEYTNIQEIPNDFFNYQLGNTLRVDFEDYTIEYRLAYMFKDSKLTNFPIQKDLPIWFWPNVYLNSSLITTYAFLNCHSIEEQVPLQWGGVMSDIKPVIIETEGTSITIDTAGSIKGPDGSIYTGTTTIPLKEGVNTIMIWTSSRWKISGSPYKVIDFGSDGTLSPESNKDLITYLGTDQGAFKATTKFPLSKLVNVEGVSVDFLKSGTNINSLDNLFEYNTKLTSIPDGTFSKLANLSGADYILEGSNIQNVDGLFEGCANLISAYRAFEDCESLVSAQRTFKDCTKLSNIDYTFGDSPQYKTLAVNCNQLFENTGVDIFTLRDFLKLSSAIGMFRNNSKLTKIDTTFTLEGDNVDVTEMFKDCPLLNNAKKQIVFELSGTANFTRCWQNCTSLGYIPEVYYKGNTLFPWNVPNAIGTQCFNGCTTLLESFGDQIPDGWK